MQRPCRDTGPGPMYIAATAPSKAPGPQQGGSQEQAHHLPASFTLFWLPTGQVWDLAVGHSYKSCHLNVTTSPLSTFRIESNDLPLLTAIASTHSPYVAQILL